MKIFKKAAFAVIGTASLVMPLGMGVVHAFSSDVANLPVNLDLQTSNLECNNPSVEVFEPTGDGCDLAIDKQVSVNGGAYAEADTSADAAQAQVGDTVTWKITVTDDSDSPLVPTGTLTVGDVLPSGASFDSYTASTGTYAGGSWTFDIFGNLPASLTITSHAVSTGLFKNIAAFSTYDPCLDGCNGAGLYADSNPDNNSNDAWMDPSAQPAVLAESTLSNTGGGTVPSIVAVGLMSAALVAGFAGKKSKSDS